MHQPELRLILSRPRGPVWSRAHPNSAQLEPKVGVLKMNLTTALVAAAAISLTASLPAIAQDDTAAAGVSREEVLATAVNLLEKPIA